MLLCCTALYCIAYSLCSVLYSAASFLSCLNAFFLFQSVSCVMDLLTRCDRVAANTPFVKWAEPVHVLLSALQDSCLVFSAQKFPAIVCDANFLKMMQVMPMNMDFVSARGMGSVKF